jgi:adenylate cyclase
LNEVQGMLSAIVHQHGGTIDKFMGDGMLAVFGAPDPLPDHAAHALRAGKALVDAMAALAVDRTPGVRVGVGIHSGEVVAGCLGSGSKLEFTVLGDTVNSASRLESLTKEHGVSALISAETVRRAQTASGVRLPALRRVGQVTLRGRSEPVEVHTLHEDRQSLASLPPP